MPPPTPTIDERLDRIERALHRLLRQHEQTPAGVIGSAEASRRSGLSAKTLGSMVRRGVLTDARKRQIAGSPLRVLADEIDLIRAGDGEAGVMRYRKQMGRI